MGERQELQKAIWGIADNLRGAVDGWDFKQYVLGTLFYRYISENLVSYVDANERESGTYRISYKDMDDETASQAKNLILQDKGFFILPSELFCNVCLEANKDNSDLNIKLDRIFKNIENSTVGTVAEKDFKGLFEDFNVTSNKLGNNVNEKNKRLLALLNGIDQMKLGNFEDNSIDAFGDAYEYLMTMYAANAGKSGGEFYTPAEVSKLLSYLALDGRKSVRKAYDMTCGSGSLLLQAAKLIGHENVTEGFYGQEINITTYNLCRINMFLHNIPYDKFDIALGDTLTDPKHLEDGPFDMEVANMPYSISWAGDNDINLANDERFTLAGVLAPKSKADFAFVMHALSQLSEDGTAAIVCFPGIMYRGGAEQKIRKYLVDNNYIDAIIQLPKNLFYGATISTCIMRLKKNRKTDKVMFVDASNEYVAVTNNNKLTDENIKKISDTVINSIETEYFSRLVSKDEIEKNNYNLSVSTYVEKEDTSEKVDIKVLNQQIKEIVTRENELRKQIDEIIAEIEGDGNE